MIIWAEEAIPIGFLVKHKIIQLSQNFSYCHVTGKNWRHFVTQSDWLDNSRKRLVRVGSWRINEKFGAKSLKMVPIEKSWLGNVSHDQSIDSREPCDFFATTSDLALNDQYFAETASAEFNSKLLPVTWQVGTEITLSSYVSLGNQYELLLPPR